MDEFVKSYMSLILRLRASTAKYPSLRIKNFAIINIGSFAKSTLDKRKLDFMHKAVRKGDSNLACLYE